MNEQKIVHLFYSVVCFKINLRLILKKRLLDKLKKFIRVMNAHDLTQLVSTCSKVLNHGLPNWESHTEEFRHLMELSLKRLAQISKKLNWRSRKILNAMAAKNPKFAPLFAQIDLGNINSDL